MIDFNKEIRVKTWKIDLLYTYLIINAVVIFILCGSIYYLMKL